MSGTGRRGTLHVVATPIGNLEDVTLRALRVLGEAALVACEDTRVTRRLLARHRIPARLVSCREHNEARVAERIVAELASGRDVALVTDAGTPGVSDPGRRVVAAAVAAGFAVLAVPGPSAVLAALSTSGEPCDRFTFLGFPPPRGRERAARLEEALALPGAVVLYEAPHRIARTLEELAALAPDRRATLHRELTKLHEEVRRGTLAELAAGARALAPRGELTLVIAGAPAAVRGGTVEVALAEARRLVRAGASPRDAARQAARAAGVARRTVYAALASGAGDEEE